MTSPNLGQQKHNTTATASMIDKIYQGPFSTSVVSGADAVIQTVFKYIDDYLRVRQEPHFISVVNPGRKNFAGPMRTRMSVGEFEVHVMARSDPST
jgi:hypothetical protein